MNWNEISKEQNLSLSFMEEHKKELQWDVVSSHITLTEEMLSTCREHFNWQKIVGNPSFSPHLVEYVSDYKEMEWKVFSLHYPLTIDLCKKIEKKLHAIYVKNNKKAKIQVVTYKVGEHKVYEYRESKTTNPEHYSLYTDYNGRTYLEYDAKNPLQNDRYDSYSSSSYSSPFYENNEYFGGF